MRSANIWIRSWLYLIAFVTWTVGLGIVGLPLLITRTSTIVVIHLWVRGIMVLARYIVRIDCRVLGRQHIPQGPCIIAGQHQSSFETYRVFLELDRPVLVLKRELTWIPIVGWYMRRGGLVPIDRGAGARAMRQMLRAADGALARGDQVVVFPEGTRVVPGSDKPYRPGIVALYTHCKVPVVPMALDSGHLWGKTRILKLPGEITFRFLPALPTGMGKDEMLTELRNRMEAVSGSAAEPPPT